MFRVGVPYVTNTTTPAKTNFKKLGPRTISTTNCFLHVSRLPDGLARGVMARGEFFDKTMKNLTIYDLV